MKLDYELSILALEDIDSIWEFTIKKWSINQAEEYYNEIFEAINVICKNPEIGQSISEVKELHRKKLVGSHLIIYKVQSQKIFVDRILHQSMDFEDL